MANGVSSRNGYQLVNGAKIFIEEDEIKIIYIYTCNRDIIEREKATPFIEENRRF